MRSLFRAILGGFGIRRVFEAGDGADGLAVMLDRQPDVVICDWLMAPVSGADFLSLLRRDTDEGLAMTPVIVVSADARKPVILRAVQLGIHEFLAKPISPALLYQRLQRVVTGKRPFLRCCEAVHPVPRGAMPAPGGTASPAMPRGGGVSRVQDAAVFI